MKKNLKWGFLIPFLIALIACIVFYYMYRQKVSEKETEAYVEAMSSQDADVLQSYLNAYPNAPERHTDSIRVHLNRLRQADQEWTNAVASKSRTALEEYLLRHPSSPNRMEAARLIDSLDWVPASTANTLDAYENYLAAHPDGNYYEDAETAQKKVKEQEVQPEEKEMVRASLRKFFQSVNSRNEEQLLASVEDVLTSFLGKEYASKSDVRHFLEKIYKEDITNMNWYLNNDYTIQKREVGDEEYEYSVELTAYQVIERTDETQSKGGHYRIVAKVSPEGKISELNMKKRE